MAYIPERFADHCNDRRLTEGQLLHIASVKRKPCGSPTKIGCVNLTPLRFSRYFTDNDAGLVTSYIVQRNCKSPSSSTFSSNNAACKRKPFVFDSGAL